jgi:hydrogenase nickel incorporation protein HypA/HybF
MHELALSQSIVASVLRAVEADPGRISRIAVSVGALSAANPSSLEFCLRLILDDRGMEHTAVDVNWQSAEVECACGRRYETDDMFAGCPECGGFDRQITAGQEVTVDYVEIEDEDEEG